jgi:hypothetical protein
VVGVTTPDPKSEQSTGPEVLQLPRLVRIALCRALPPWGPVTPSLPTRTEYLLIRQRWAQVTNEALRQAGPSARVDHRSLQDQGIDREPTPTMPERIGISNARPVQGWHSFLGR